MARTMQEFQTWIDSRESQIQKEYKAANKADVRHKCFISYHHADQEEVEKFITEFEDVFIPQVLGISNVDDFIDSKDTDYVMDQIREKYLTTSTVTIVMVGKCTWSRKYIDWEIYSTLRNSKNDKRSGLIAITLKSIADSTKTLPSRLRDNVNADEGYARWYKYPTTDSSLRTWIEEAFQAKKTKFGLIKNTRAIKDYNEACS